MKRRDREYDITSWITALFKEFRHLGIRLEMVNAFLVKYTYRMRKGKWDEHHFKYQHPRRMHLRRQLGAMRKQLFVLPDPSSQVVPVSVDKVEQWHRNSSSQHNSEHWVCRVLKHKKLAWERKAHDGTFMD